jgi:hypothetical protein
LVDVRARFNPFDPPDITRALHRALTDDESIGVLARVPDPAFSWDLAVERLVGVYDELLTDSRTVEPLETRTDATAGTVPSAAADRPPIRLAVAGALLPERSAAAKRLRERVLHRLVADDRFTVTAYSVPHRPEQLGDYRCAVRPFAELALAWEEGEVDAVVYAVGERAPSALVAAMSLLPGHVVFTSDRHRPIPVDRVVSAHDADDDDLADRLASSISAARQAERLGAT